MILNSLRELARRDRLVEEPAFQSMPVRWVITLDSEGKFLSLEEADVTPPATGKKKPKPQYKLREIPRRSGRTSGDKAEFLVDKSDYVLGVLPEEATSPKSETRRLLFLKELQKAGTEIQDPVLLTVIRFLEDANQRESCIAKLKQSPFTSNDLFTFRVEGQMLEELRSVRDYWVRQMANAEEQQHLEQCLLCGEQKPLVDKHDLLKLPGAVTSGVALISANAGAFEKHGLEGNRNAPMCRECMVAYVNALRRCLDANYPNPDGGSFSKQSVRLSDNTAAVYWDDSSSGLTGGLFGLNDGSPKDVKALFDSAWKGLKPADFAARFYCLILTGSQGRASVRGMHTSTLGRVIENLSGESGYFECLRSAGFLEEPAPIFSLIRSLAVQGKVETLPPSVAGELFLSAVMGVPLSHFFLSTTVGRIRAERQVPKARAALLHLYFQRSLKPMQRNVPMSLDVDSPEPAYRYGRLLAVLEYLQSRALGRKPNSTIVDRYYSAASTRPATAFPPLLALAQNHLRSVESAGYFSKEIEQILSGLNGASGFKRTLNIEEQGKFALGYFHQKNFSRPKAAHDAAPTNQNDNIEENQ
jgi:CRISPR-associated protein Csd1